MTDLRLLLLDFTSMLGPAATSTLKAAYFNDWQDDKLLHLMDMGRGHIGLATGANSPRILLPEIAQAARFIETFNPQIILYRPVADSSEFHTFSMAVIKAGLAAGGKCALWMMDDWPTRLEQTDPTQFQLMNTDLRNLFAQSSINFAISNGMARTFEERYGVTFEVAHNGIIPEEWPAHTRKKNNKITIRYAGSLAPDTTKDSVATVAKLVSNLAQQGVNVRLEGRTQKHWMQEQGRALNKLEAVSFAPSNFSEAAYRQWLSEADILLVAYNFDAATRTYLKYSFANKVPENLAAGAAILAYGPDELETISYLKNSNTACMVTQEDETKLQQALMTLINNRDERETLGIAAREHAFRTFNLNEMKRQFRTALAQTMSPPSKSLHDPSDGMGARKTIDAIAGPYVPRTIYRQIADKVNERAPNIAIAARAILGKLRTRP